LIFATNIVKLKRIVHNFEFFKVESEVRALKFDDTGLFLLAGTKNGSIHVLEATDSSNLKFNFKVQLARGGVTNITFAPAQGGNLPCLLVNTSDSHVSIIDVVYHGQVLTNLVVRYRAKVPHSLLPLKFERKFDAL
jgi:hypothetical protein